VPDATATSTVQDTAASTTNTNDHNNNETQTINNDTIPAVESPEVAPEPMATPAAAAPSSSDDSQGMQDTTTVNQATATATVSRRLAGPKAASKSLADNSLLAPPHMRQMEVEWVKKDKVHIDALKACRLQVAHCRWYQQAYN
jgi:uncharacterized phage infection (PIP) family protein YhgE